MTSIKEKWGIRSKVRGQIITINNINFGGNPSPVDGYLSHESTELPPKSESNSYTCLKLGISSKYQSIMPATSISVKKIV